MLILYCKYIARIKRELELKAGDKEDKLLDPFRIQFWGDVINKVK